MSEPVTLPLWLAVLVGVLASWALLDRMLVPGARWFLRRRVNRAIQEVNTRLRIRLQPLKLTKREVLLDRLVYDSEVMEAVEEEARREGTPREVVSARVSRYAREIVPAFNAYFYFRVGYWISRQVARFLYRVRLGYTDVDRLQGVPEDAAVVFVMNHRSNMDYVLVSYLVAEHAALSYAVGEWARIWPLETLVRSMGAYFVRRNSKNPLYRRVLERYVAMAVEGGVTQAMFPEGGLSRDGALREAKLGLLDYMLRSFDPAGERDLIFIPVGINYDRVLEDRSLLLDLVPKGERRKAPPVRTAFTFLLRNLGLMLRNKWHRFGYAVVNLGPPVSAREFLELRGTDPRKLPRAERFEVTAELARELMTAVGRQVPVAPVPLVAAVFLEADGAALSELELKARVFDRMRLLGAAGARLYLPRKDQDYAVSVGLRMLLLRHVVEERDGLYRARPEERSLLTYYAGSIAHLEAEPGSPQPETAWVVP